MPQSKNKTIVKKVKNRRAKAKLQIAVIYPLFINSPPKLL